ncbi:hypothetical protein CBL_08673 [Carabus blaptoides fortunei]
MTSQNHSWLQEILGVIDRFSIKRARRYFPGVISGRRDATRVGTRDFRIQATDTLQSESTLEVGRLGGRSLVVYTSTLDGWSITTRDDASGRMSLLSSIEYHGLEMLLTVCSTHTPANTSN